MHLYYSGLYDYTVYQQQILQLCQWNISLFQVEICDNDDDDDDDHNDNDDDDDYGDDDNDDDHDDDGTMAVFEISQKKDKYQSFTTRRDEDEEENEDDDCDDKNGKDDNEMFGSMKMMMIVAIFIPLNYLEPIVHYYVFFGIIMKFASEM